MQAITGGVALVVAGAVALGFVLFFNAKELRYKTQAALRGSLGTVASDELRHRGITLGAKLRCADIPGWTKERMRARCNGVTADKRRVQVIGTGLDKTKKQHFTILVGGKPIVENAPCLGADCKKDD